MEVQTAVISYDIQKGAVPYCGSLEQSNLILSPLEQKLDSGSGCWEIKQCTHRSYFGSRESVHYPEVSLTFNGAQGLCGLMGGLKERSVTHTNGIYACFSCDESVGKYQDSAPLCAGFPRLSRKKITLDISCFPIAQWVVYL